MYRRVSYYYYRQGDQEKVFGPNNRDQNARYNNLDSMVFGPTDIGIAPWWSYKVTTFTMLLQKNGQVYLL